MLHLSPEPKVRILFPPVEGRRTIGSSAGDIHPIKPVFEEAPAHRDSLEEPERRPKPEGPTSATDQRLNRSLNHFVGAGEGRWRDCDAERLGSVEVHHELEGRRLLDWQIGGLCAVEDLAGVTAGLTPCAGEARVHS
jgi:hypothetical protein